MTDSYKKLIRLYDSVCVENQRISGSLLCRFEKTFLINNNLRLLSIAIAVYKASRFIRAHLIGRDNNES
tara:strand:+ start:967 stop:1173 length:207 start_codon:yes stop_codon:yes gene_type:complete